jgi:hypothetical protein
VLCITIVHACHLVSPNCQSCIRIRYSWRVLLIFPNTRCLKFDLSADMPKVVRGLRLLSQSDPCVETFQQQTGEHVILTAGELHLEVNPVISSSISTTDRLDSVASKISGSGLQKSKYRLRSLSYLSGKPQSMFQVCVLAVLNSAVTQNHR